MLGQGLVPAMGQEQGLVPWELGLVPAIGQEQGLVLQQLGLGPQGLGPVQSWELAQGSVPQELGLVQAGVHLQGLWLEPMLGPGIAKGLGQVLAHPCSSQGLGLGLGLQMALRIGPLLMEWVQGQGQPQEPGSMLGREPRQA